MSKINDTEFIQELKFSLGQEDIIKAKALLQFFPQAGKPIHKQVLYEISKARDKVAFTILEFLLELPDLDPAFLTGVYPLLLDKAISNTSRLIRNISRTELKNRYLYIRIAGDLQVHEAVPALIDILVNETDILILKEAIKSLSAAGSSSAIRAIADFIYYGNEELKQEAIFALSEIGGKSAIHQLAEAVNGTSDTDQLIIQALADIQDHLAIEKLCGMISSHHVNVRNWAMDHLIEIGPKAVPSVIDNLQCDDDDTLVHTMNILGNIGDKTAINAIQKILYSKPDNANVRFAAYEALERLPSSKTAISLATGLQDPEEQVRLAAARAVNKNMSPILAAGLKNMISSEDEQAQTLVATLIDAEADIVFSSMIELENFTRMAVDYIAVKADPSTKNHFIKVLDENGKKEIIGAIEAASTGTTAEKQLNIVVVDDSKMMLRLYRKKIHKFGYSTKEFEFPEMAIQEIEKNKPDLLITDLNMPVMNGIELTQRTRSHYSIEDLPIIMITTQSDFVGQQSSESSLRINDETMRKIGVNIVMHKPFADEELEQNIKKLTESS